MKTKPTLAGAALTAAFALNFTAPDAAAYRGTGDPLISDAHRMGAIASELDEQFWTHFRHLPAIRILTADADRVAETARWICGLEHSRYVPLRHVRAELTDLEHVVKRMDRVVDFAETGPFASRIRGRTCDVKRTLDELAELVCGMTRLVDRRIELGEPRCGVTTGRPVHRGARHEVDEFSRHRSHGYSHTRGNTYSYDNGRGFHISLSTVRGRY